MDVASVMEEVNTWSAADRLRLVESVWNSIVSQGQLQPLTDAQKLELDRRSADLAEHPERAIPWEAVESYIRHRR